jgi:hypothetical protein
MGSRPESGRESGRASGNEPADRWKRLPEPVKLEDTREIHEAAPVPDPLAGRDTERDFMLRWAVI